jgi:hypothetical protein
MKTLQVKVYDSDAVINIYMTAEKAKRVMNRWKDCPEEAKIEMATKSDEDYFAIRAKDIQWMMIVPETPMEANLDSLTGKASLGVA